VDHQPDRHRRLRVLRQVEEKSEPPEGVCEKFAEIFRWLSGCRI
jgi:hypothetical protein